jgi:hypothetical protein
MNSKLQHHNDHTAADAENREIPLAYRHRLHIDPQAQTLTLSGGQHGQSIIILLHENGMEVHAHAAKLQLKAAEEIELCAPKINLNAAKDLRLLSQGNLITHAAKDALHECGGVNKSIAADQKLTATVGNVEVKANDDVKIDGERVLLNS